MTPPGHAAGLPDWRALIARIAPGDEVVAGGGTLNPAMLLSAYRGGAFPMGAGPEGAEPILWWSPDPRGVLRPSDLRVTRSLRKSVRRFRVSVDTAFDAVVAGCADPSRDGRWITPDVARAYARLHELGHAHSVEVWDDEGLAGGLYGVCVGGLFAGESMFHRARDASKVALVHLCELMAAGADGPGRLIDMQWLTDHLASLGGIEIPRADYLAELDRVSGLSAPEAFRRGIPEGEPCDPPAR